MRAHEQDAARDTAADAVLLRCDDIDRSFGGLRALAGVSLAVATGEIVGLVGPNGSGKTTLVNVVSGFYRPQKGRVIFRGDDITHLPPHRVAGQGIARTFQNLALFHGMTVLDNILLGRHVRLRPGPLATLAYWPWTRRREIAHRRAVEEIIDFLQLEGVRKVPVDFVPLGLQRRVELARALAAEPTLLVLDEPMAGMNQEEKEYMARFILDARDELGMTVLLIEHHMDVVTGICDRMIVLDHGEKIAEGLPEAVVADPKVVTAYIGATTPGNGSAPHRPPQGAVSAHPRTS
jgi:branched-chain amino acid transport system ATP-binding protein